MMNIKNQEARIIDTYARRNALGKSTRYSWFLQDVLFSQFRFRSVAASMMIESGISDLSDVEVLDVGCGMGGWLRTLLEWGVNSNLLHGIDLLEDRIAQAQTLNPGIDYQIASGWLIPFSDASMDMVFANTVFSSITDPPARKILAKEMTRILRPTGHIMVFDFRISHPLNKDTVGIRRSEIKRIFPEFDLKIRSLILLPPLARKLAKISPLLVGLIELTLPFLRSHAIYFLNKHEI
jgi:SAM-dependent methyltransferase